MQSRQKYTLHCIHFAHINLYICNQTVPRSVPRAKMRSMINFYLKEPKTSEATLIYLVANIAGKRYKISLNEKIKPADWNSQKQRAREKYQQPELRVLNKYLDDIQTRAAAAVKDAKYNNKVLTNEMIKAAIFGREEVQFFDLINAFYTEELSKRGAASVKQVKTLINHLQKFDPKATVAAISPGYFNKYIAYLSGQNFSANYIGAHMKNFKKFVRWAADGGHTINTEILKIKTIKEDVDAVYLTAGELQSIFEMRSLPAYLENARDLFLIGCYTGQRFSDFNRLKLDQFKDNFIYFTQAKTGARVVIPIHENMTKIIMRNGGGLPRSLSNQKLNKHIKEVCRAAGLLQIVSTTRTEGGRRVERKKYKFELVGTHTARRSFATNAYLQGLPVTAIMKLTGHKSEKEFYKYLKIDALQNAELIKNHAFFKAV